MRADGADLALERHRGAEADRELGGHAPDVGVRDEDRPPDGLVEDRRADATVQAPRVALVFDARREDAEELGGAPAHALARPVRRLLEHVEPRVQPVWVVGAADEAHAADVLDGDDAPAPAPPPATRATYLRSSEPRMPRASRLPVSLPAARSTLLPSASAMLWRL